MGEEALCGGPHLTEIASSSAESTHTSIPFIGLAVVLVLLPCGRWVQMIRVRLSSLW